MVKKLSIEPYIHENCRLTNSKLGEYTEVGLYNSFENVVLGDYSYTGQFCIIQNTTIGKFSNIAAMVRIGPTNHPMERPTLHHFTYRRMLYGMDTEDDTEFFEKRVSKITYIGHDTWIGHGCIIMPGVTIGNGAVVGSGCIVTKDVKPYEVVVGVPAKVVKMRFEKDIIDKMDKICWWDWSYEKIKECLPDFLLSANEFTKKHGV